MSINSNTIHVSRAAYRTVNNDQRVKEAVLTQTSAIQISSDYTKKHFKKNIEMSSKWCKTTFYWVMNHLMYAFMLLLTPKPMDKWDQYVM